MARRKREEWICPQCGLTGDHMKSPDPTRCKTCCRVDAAEDLYRALTQIEQAFVRRRPLRPHTSDALLASVRAALAKARGEP